MRIAICSTNMLKRHNLSLLSEKALIKHGVLPCISLFPTVAALLRSIAYGNEQYKIAVIETVDNCEHTRALCNALPVILVGERDDGPKAFDVGACYFIEHPPNEDNVKKAFSDCIKRLQLINEEG